MGEPLSVAASVAGLLSLAGQIYQALNTFINNVQDAPSFANSICSEVQSFQNALGSLQILFGAPIAQSQRAMLIPVDYILLALTDATLLFSEIEDVVMPLTTVDNFALRNRVRWTQKRTKLDSLVSRLQWQKLTLVLHLNILKSGNDGEAYSDLAILTQHCMQKLAVNTDLERRLEQVETQLLDLTPSNQDAASLNSTGSDSSDKTAHPARMSILDQYPVPREFEEDLFKSWVYRRNQHQRESMSIRSSRRQSAWSALSEISLAKISVISVIALPVQRAELFNSAWYPITGSPEKDSMGNIDNVDNIPDPDLQQSYTLIKEAAPLIHTNQISDGVSDEDLDFFVEISQRPDPIWSESERKALLSKALKSAHTAVLLDTKREYAGAWDAYEVACSSLRRVLDNSANTDEKVKLRGILNTYFERTVELNALLRDLHSGVSKKEIEEK